MILIVDDHPDSCDMLRRLVEKVGYRALSITGSREALEFIEAVRPRLVVLDVMMPEMSGFDVLRVMKARDDLATIPVIVYTAGGDPGWRDEAFALGAIDFATKGQTSLTELLERINSVYCEFPEAAAPPPAAPRLQASPHDHSGHDRVSDLLTTSRRLIQKSTELSRKCKQVPR